MEYHVQEFIDRGFAIVPGLFNDRDIHRLREALERIVTKVSADPAAYDTRYTAKSDEVVDIWGVNHIFLPELYEEAIAQVFDNAGLMSVVRAVLGDKLRFWGAHALWSPRIVDYELHWHRDFGDHYRFDPSGATTHVQFNVCLFDEACFRAVPGSHRRPLTPEEQAEVDAKGLNPLPGEVVAECRAGDVLFMNAHTLHRGSCQAGLMRRTLHINLQPQDEPTGGHTSWSFMREEGYLDRMTSTVRSLMQNTIDWDDTHPLPLSEMRRRMRISRDIKQHEARRVTQS